MSQPTVSVVIPAYNRAATIIAAVRSVQEQTYQDWEIVVVDDGSTDNTVGLVEQLSRKDARVRLVRHDRNRGAQAARNSGLRAATGEWIAFLDSDDQWLPDSLKIRLETVRREGRFVIYSECYVIRENNVRERFGIPAWQGWIYRDLLANPGPMFQSLLVAKKALEKIGFLDESIRSYQEWDTSIRLAKEYPFSFLPEPTFIYDCRGQDTISKNIPREGMGYEQVFRKHTWAIVRNLGPRAMVEHYHAAAMRYEKAGLTQAVAHCRRMEFLWWPFRPRLILRQLGRFWTR